MKNKKSIFKLVTVSVVAAIVAYLGLQKIQNPTNNDHKTVAITQIVQHDSLDKIRKGIVDELTAQKLNYKLVYENAQGNVAIASQIASKFIGINPDVIVSITTPSTQAAYSEAAKRQIPVIYGAVSDPVNARLIQSDTKSRAGITGVSDLPPIHEQVSFIKTILNNNGKQDLTIGILYNSGEANSVAMVNQFKSAAAKLNIATIEAVALRSSEVLTAARSLIGKVDLVYIPNDNTVISSVNSVIQLCLEAKLPIISSDPESVEKGCIGAIAIDQYLVGRQTGEMVARLLKGEPINSIQPQQARDKRMTINLESAKRIGLKIPPELIQQAHYTIHQ